jgi:hypothetical protein
MGRYGISESEVIPFHVYHPALVTSYEPIVNDEMCDRLKRKKLFEDGFDAFGKILSAEVFESIVEYELPEVIVLEFGVAFEKPETNILVEILKKAQKISVEQYNKVARIHVRLARTWNLSGCIFQQTL